MDEDSVPARRGRNSPNVLSLEISPFQTLFINIEKKANFRFFLAVDGEGYAVVVTVKAFIGAIPFDVASLDLPIAEKPLRPLHTVEDSNILYILNSNS